MTELRVLPGRAHAITPKRGTAVSLRTGLPANLTDMMSYPVEAVCLVCGGRVVCEQATSVAPDGGWRHEERSR
ncbi:MAG TPA: hypothetical protein VFE59_08940 [Trebonia sp.]|nr:hypothetical protein [Trebonia sp.]